jgi:DNA-binding protein
MESHDIQVSGSQDASVVVAEAAKVLESLGRVRLVGINFAMAKLVQAVEIIKHKVEGLHQLNEVQHLDESNKTRLHITLSFSLLAASHHGYQPPLPASQVSSVSLSELARAPPKEERPPRKVWGRDRPELAHAEGPKDSSHRPHQGRKPGWVDPARRPPQGSRPDRADLGRRPPHDRPESQYERVPRPQEEDKIEENELRVTARRPAKYVVKEAVLLLKQKNFPSVVLKGSGTAIPQVVEVAESLRHSVAGLHQVSTISRREVTDLLRAKEAGLADIEKTRTVPTLEIVLSRSAQDTRHYGYQAPLPVSQVREMSLEEALSQ